MLLPFCFPSDDLRSRRWWRHSWRSESRHLWPQRLLLPYSHLFFSLWLTHHQRSVMHVVSSYVSRDSFSCIRFAVSRSPPFTLSRRVLAWLLTHLPLRRVLDHHFGLLVLTYPSWRLFFVNVASNLFPCVFYPWVDWEITLRLSSWLLLLFSCNMFLRIVLNEVSESQSDKSTQCMGNTLTREFSRSYWYRIPSDKHSVTMLVLVVVVVWLFFRRMVCVSVKSLSDLIDQQRDVDVVFMTHSSSCVRQSSHDWQRYRKDHIGSINRVSWTLSWTQIHWLSCGNDGIKVHYPLKPPGSLLSLCVSQASHH